MRRALLRYPAGGTWFPLDSSGGAFATIGWLMPSAWARIGYQNILVRGLGLSSIWKSGEFASRLAKGFFAVAFGWIGLVFFLVLGQELPAHNAQAFLFLSLAGLFTLDLFVNTSPFRMPSEGWRKTATLTGFGLTLAYPLVGLLVGRPPSGWIIPGAFPCPTTALALVFMATAFAQKRRWLYLVTLGLLLLRAIPFPILIQIPQYRVYEDGIMLVLGIYALVGSIGRFTSTRTMPSI